MSTKGDQNDGTSTCTRQVKKYSQNGYSPICVQAAGKLPCRCYYWNQMSSWGCSPTRNELKLWNPPLLTIPRKAQKVFLEWPTPENTPPWGSTLSSKALH